MLLGVETSCDETAAAVVTEDGRILANVVSSQADLHARYGGVVPEVASRRHLELVAPVVEEALAEAGTSLDEIDAVAVTRGPGLIGALLVGISAAKALAWSRGETTARPACGTRAPAESCKSSAPAARSAPRRSLRTATPS